MKTYINKIKKQAFSILAACLVIGQANAAIVSHWKFDEAGGTTAFDSAGQFHGALSTTGASIVPGGISGNALSVDRALNGFVNIGTGLSFSNRPFSIVAWIKTPTGYNINDSQIVSKHAAFTANGFWLSVNRTGGGGQLGKAIFGEGAAWLSVTSTTTVTDGQWHQIVVTFNPGVSRSIYVDGAPVEQSNTASASLVANSVAFLIGGVTVNGIPEGRFTGLIDEVQVYSRVLSPAEVDLLYQNPGQIVIECEEAYAKVLAELVAANSTIVFLETEMAGLKDELAICQAEKQAFATDASSINLSLNRLTQNLRRQFNNPNFVIPGSNDAERIHNLVVAILRLNHGQKQSIYFNLQGTGK